MLIEPNPFVYSHPLAPEDVIDRDAETAELLQKAAGGHYVRLYAPRKFGKTSLLKRVLRDATVHDDFVGIHVDLYRVMSLTDVAVRFERAYAAQLKGPLAKAIDSFLKKTGVGVSLSAYGISAAVQTRPAAFDPVPALHTLLELPAEFDKNNVFRTLIVFDEFQDIERIAGLDGLIRSHIQYHGEIASYVFAGSEAGLMKQLFEDKDRPLYGSAVPIRLGRLRDDDIAAYVATRFEETGRDVGAAINLLLRAARGHPKQAMLLAHRLWEEVARGGEATLEDWDRAYAAALAELDAEFDAQWRGLDASEQRTLRSIVDGRGAPYRTEVLRALDLSKGSVQKAIPRLMARAELEELEGRYEVVDPLFAAWIDAG
jgi:uncharacterized protein